MKGIILFLSGTRGVECASALTSAGHSISCLCIPEDRDCHDIVGRLSLGVDTVVERCTRVNDERFVERIRALAPRLSVIAGFPTIFRASLRDSPELGTINLHAGRLPAYRGGSPLNWQIINGETLAGLSVIRVDQGIDTGPLLAEAELVIEPDDEISDLHRKANARFASLLVEVIRGIESGELKEKIQPASGARYWHQRAPEDGEIDWPGMTASQVHNLVRAVTRPYPGAFTWLDGEKVTIFRTLVPDDDIRGVPGRVCRIAGRGPFVICRDRAIQIVDCDGQEARLSHRVHLGRR